MILEQLTYCILLYAPQIQNLNSENKNMFIIEDVYLSHRTVCMNGILVTLYLKGCA